MYLCHGFGCRGDENGLIEVATERARLDIISAKAAAGRVEQELTRMSRERLLPDEKALEKVARYEAHLSRLFHKALHELEALQIRRTGGSAPLARRRRTAGELGASRDLLAVTALLGAAGHTVRSFQ
jgi:hypothetical protein